MDLSHHFSRVTKARKESSIKEFYKYFTIPGIGNLAGGLPNASFFPYDTLEASVALPDRFEPTPNDPNEVNHITKKLAKTSLKPEPIPSARMLVPHASGVADPMRKIDLTTALQYGQASGYPPLFSFIRQFTRENLHPNVPYVGGPEIQLTVGSTDGFAKTIEALSDVWNEEHDPVEERPGVLCEEFAYMNAIQAARPRGLQVVPVRIDSEGMLPGGEGGLEDVLANWDSSRGRRPHLMYTVTMGQNPTSATLGVERRKELYAICSKYDVVIIEDDPYWYLQFPSAAPAEATARGLPQPKTSKHTLRATDKSSRFPFLDSLVPSYLSVDTDGRVVRLDTFSKTIAPGCRLGWVTGQPAIVERILRITETSTQQPSGFVQSMVAELIMGPQAKNDGGRGGLKDGEGWKVDGWVRWLEGLRGVYERRMNRMCQIFEDGRFYLKQQRWLGDEEDDWAVVSKVKLYDFEWPRAGMFVWIKIAYESHPLWGQVEGPKLARALWIFLTTKPYLVLASPGQIFSPTEEIAEKEGWKYFRLCFAAVSEEEVDASSARFVKGVQAFWRIKSKKELDDIEPPSSAEKEDLVDLGFNWTC
jgi:DNA-binding transcriptional MocR family regulator